MAITKLPWHDLVPDTENYQEVFEKNPLKMEIFSLFSKLQPRLYYALRQLLTPWSSCSFMFLKAPEEFNYLKLISHISHIIRQFNSNGKRVFGGKYKIDGEVVTFEPSIHTDEEFAVNGNIITSDWAVEEQLFGCLRKFNDALTINPGLVHRANGGVLIITLRTFISQPLLWLRLKSIVSQRRFYWITSDQLHPLPVTIPSMPLSLKVVFIGNQDSLASFQEIDPDILSFSIYSEFEDSIQIENKKQMALWCNWIRNVANRAQLPIPTSSAWPVLIREAVRFTGDHKTFPLCLLWICKQLCEVYAISKLQKFTGKQLTRMFTQRKWREGFLRERIQNQILVGQIILETEGAHVGQINALSVTEFPGHPCVFGEPVRISCVVYIGEGDLTDIERKAEIGGNIHAKGVMIMQAFLMAHLKLKQRIPFSSSLTFEQSYDEVDGDSASMAELCVLISALANVPINQGIAITGSVDQFGRAQPVGNLNEKIESFFAICKHRGLTSKQGVIIPSANARNLSLHYGLLRAVKEKKFHIWTIENITDALLLLTGLRWDGKGKETLVHTIQNRIDKAIQQEDKYRFSWLSYFFSK